MSRQRRRERRDARFGVYKSRRGWNARRRGVVFLSASERRRTPPCRATRPRARAPGPVRAHLPPRVRRVQARLREGGRGRLRPLVGRHETRLVASESFVFVSSSLAFVRFAVRFAAYARRFAARLFANVKRAFAERASRVSRLMSASASNANSAAQSCVISARRSRATARSDLRSDLSVVAAAAAARGRRKDSPRASDCVFLVLLRALGGFRDAPRSLRARLRHRARLRARLVLAVTAAMSPRDTGTAVSRVSRDRRSWVVSDDDARRPRRASSPADRPRACPRPCRWRRRGSPRGTWEGEGGRGARGARPWTSSASDARRRRRAASERSAPMAERSPRSPRAARAEGRTRRVTCSSFVPRVNATPEAWSVRGASPRSRARLSRTRARREMPFSRCCSFETRFPRRREKDSSIRRGLSSARHAPGRRRVMTESSDDIPIVDLSADPASVASVIRDACVRHGFFYLTITACRGPSSTACTTPRGRSSRFRRAPNAPCSRRTTRTTAVGRLSARRRWTRRRRRGEIPRRGTTSEGGRSELGRTREAPARPEPVAGRDEAGIIERGRVSRTHDAVPRGFDEPLRRAHALVRGGARFERELLRGQVQVPHGDAEASAVFGASEPTVGWRLGRRRALRLRRAHRVVDGRHRGAGDSEGRRVVARETPSQTPKRVHMQRGRPVRALDQRRVQEHGAQGRHETRRERRRRRKRRGRKPSAQLRVFLGTRLRHARGAFARVRRGEPAAKVRAHDVRRVHTRQVQGDARRLPAGVDRASDQRRRVERTENRATLSTDVAVSTASSP